MVAFGIMISYFMNFDIGIHIKSGPNIWRIPFGFQLVPAGILGFGLLTIKESPSDVRNEIVEMDAQIEEERKAREGLKEGFFGKGVYYAPQIFTSIGYTGTKNSLLASGIHGVVKVLSLYIYTSTLTDLILFVFFSVESLGRRMSLIISSFGMGTLFFIIGALLKTQPPPTTVSANPPPASKAMAATLYIYVCFYSIGWGPFPWVYVSDIFPTRTRHFGLATASAWQWLLDFVVSKVTPDIITNTEYNIFLGSRLHRRYGDICLFPP
ncbi:hypothetical protein H0H93_008103 [Arthromyces matolae]|nr:hypothetical protein H0H93_008103 [Arthromyces matolae]